MSHPRHSDLTASRVSKLRKRSLFQCRASAELWTTNRPDARLARSLTKNIRKRIVRGNQQARRGVAVSQASARVSGLSHQHTGAGEFRKFNANTDRRGHDRRCNPAVDADQLARQPLCRVRKPDRRKRVAGRSSDRHRLQVPGRRIPAAPPARPRSPPAASASGRSAATRAAPDPGTPHVGESDYIAARCPARPNPVP